MDPHEDRGEARDREHSLRRVPRALFDGLLEGVGGRRPELERAVLALATPQLQEELPAIDCGVLLLFMSELHDGLPLAVACSEAVALSKAYSGAHHTMVNGVLAAYAQDMKSRGLEVDTS